MILFLQCSEIPTFSHKSCIPSVIGPSPHYSSGCLGSRSIVFYHFLNLEQLHHHCAFRKHCFQIFYHLPNSRPALILEFREHNFPHNLTTGESRCCLDFKRSNSSLRAVIINAITNDACIGRSFGAWQHCRF